MIKNTSTNSDAATRVARLEIDPLLEYRLRFANCRNYTEALELAYSLLRQAELTGEGRRCDHCQLADYCPAPSCLAGEPE